VNAVSLDELYAFQYTATDITQRSVGWNFFDLQSEFLRMGVPNDNWVLSHINKDYEVCMPEKNVVFLEPYDL